MPKTIFAAIAAVAIGFSMGAIAQDRVSTPDPANLTDGVPIAPQKTMQVEFFLNKLHAMSQEEAKYARISVGRSENKNVKEYAGMVIAAHAEIEKHVSRLAKAKNFTLDPAPGENKTTVQGHSTSGPPEAEAREVVRRQKQVVEKLASSRGEDFNRDYAEIMVSEHERLLRFLDTAKRQLDDDEAKALIDQIRPIVRLHKVRAMDIAHQFRVRTSAAFKPAASPAN